MRTSPPGHAVERSSPMEGELGYAPVGESSVAYRAFDGAEGRDFVVMFDAWVSMEVL